MTTSTTIISTRVKPAAVARRFLILAPVANVGVLALAALATICAERKHVDHAMGARRAVLIRIAPRILGQTADVAALPIALDLGKPSGRGHQGLQTLLGRRKGEQVELVALQRLLEH